MRYSIITINYNNEEGLRHTIESIVCQTYTDFEFIIIDGGSTDGSVDVIKEYAEHIAYWVSEKDNGRYNAMNKGVCQAKGDYCIFMNSGDCFYKENVLKEISTQLKGCDIFVGKIISSSTKSILFAPPHKEMSLYYLYSSTVPHQSSFIKRNLLTKYPYDETLEIVSDWKFYVQAIVFGNCTIYYSDVITTLFDMNGVSTSNPQKTWDEKQKVLSELFPPRVIADYQLMKRSECLTQLITPQLRRHYKIDKLLYLIGRFLLFFIK